MVIFCFPELLCYVSRMYSGVFMDGSAWVWSVLGETVWFVILLIGCENLIRKMLIVDPRKRLTIGQICQHPWMQEASPDVRQDPLVSDTAAFSTQDGKPYNEHVLRLMHSHNIDESKTVEVCITSCLSLFLGTCLSGTYNGLGSFIPLPVRSCSKAPEAKSFYSLDAQGKLKLWR